MSIAITITNEQFYQMYKDNQFVRPMTFEAVDSILDYMSEMTETPDVAVDWTPWFMSASEYTLEDFIAEFRYTLDKSTVEEMSNDREDLALEIAMNLEDYVRRIEVGEETHYIVFS